MIPVCVLQAVGEPWIRELEAAEYGALPLQTRLAILGALMQLALDGPSVRAALEGKLEEAARVRKAMAEAVKVCCTVCLPGWQLMSYPSKIGPALSEAG